MARIGRIATSALAVVTLVESARRARACAVDETEERVFRTCNEAPDGVHAPVWAVMQSGSLASVFVVSGVFAYRGRIRTATAALVTGCAVWGGVKAVKPLIGRGRPRACLPHVSVRGQPQTGLGYPSGHAAVATTLALIATHDASPRVRATALALAGVTAGARMYVGAHLPLDVAGGLAIGVLCGNGAISMLDAFTPGTTPTPNRLG